MKKDIKDVELFLFDLDGTVYIGDNQGLHNEHRHLPDY